jgi:hypothetical protein
MPNQGVVLHSPGFRIGEVALNNRRPLARSPNGARRRHCILAHRDRDLAAPSTGKSGESRAHRDRVVQDLTETAARYSRYFVCCASAGCIGQGPLVRGRRPASVLGPVATLPARSCIPSSPKRGTANSVHSPSTGRKSRPCPIE